MISRALFPYAINDNLEEYRLLEKYWAFGFYEDNVNFIDLSMGNCGCFTLGFDRTDIVDKVSERIKDTPFCSGEFKTSNSVIQTLASKLFDLSGGYRSIFSLSGSDAIEGAIRVAHLYNVAKNQNRKEIIGFENSYHGSTFLSSSIADTRDMHHLYGREGNCITLRRQETDLDRDWSNTLCVVIETCSWQDGLKPVTQEFWKKLRHVCTENDVILIVDDIAMCGGKTGNMFGWKNEHGETLIQPDIFTMGKGFTGGFYPLSATLVNDVIYQTIMNLPLLHGFSYSFSLSGIYSVLEYMDILEKEQILKKHSVIKNSAVSLFEKLRQENLIKDFNNHGLVFNLNLLNENYLENQDTLESHFKRFGLSSGMFNEAGDGLLIIVPLTATDAYFIELSKRLRSALESYNRSTTAIPDQI